MNLRTGATEATPQRKWGTHVPGLTSGHKWDLVGTDVEISQSSLERACIVPDPSCHQGLQATKWEFLGAVWSAQGLRETSTEPDSTPPIGPAGYPMQEFARVLLSSLD